MPTPLDQAWPDFSLGGATGPNNFWKVGDANYIPPTYEGETRVYKYQNPYALDEEYNSLGIGVFESFHVYRVVFEDTNLIWTYAYGYDSATDQMYDPPKGVGHTWYRYSSGNLLIYWAALDTSARCRWFGPVTAPEFLLIPV